MMPQHMNTNYIFRKLLLTALKKCINCKINCKTKRGLGVVYREPLGSKTMETSKKCLYFKDFIPEPIFYLIFR